MATPGWRELFGGGHGGRAIALAAGVTLHAVNIFVATTIMPSVVAEIGGLAYYAWNATLFIVGSIVGSALASELLARHGARGAYRIAALAFAAGSLAAALAPTMPVLLAARALQGLGGGMLFALSYALIRLVLPQELWPRAIALGSGTWGAAALSGPFVGGIFAESGQWRLAFWAVLAATGAFALLCARVLPAPGTAPPPIAAGRFPSRRLALLAGAALAISGASVVPSLWVNAAGLAVALLLLVAMVRLERAATVRLLPSDALRPATPLGAVYLTMGLVTVGTNAIVFVPLLLQVLHGLSPLGAGYLTVLQAASAHARAPTTDGGLSARASYRSSHGSSNAGRAACSRTAACLRSSPRCSISRGWRTASRRAPGTRRERIACSTTRRTSRSSGGSARRWGSGSGSMRRLASTTSTPKRS